MSDEVVRYIDINDLDNITIYNIGKTKDNILYLKFYAIVRLGLVYSKDDYKNNPYLYDTLFDVNLIFRRSEYTYEVYYKNDNYVLLISDEYIDNLYKNIIKFDFTSIDCTDCNIIYSDDYKYGRIRQKYKDKDYMYIMCTKLPASVNSSITTIDTDTISIEPYTEEYIVSIIRKDNEGNGKSSQDLLADEIMKTVRKYIAVDDVCMIYK